MDEFSHYSGCKGRDPKNCSGCALTTGDEKGPDYAGWALAYIRNHRDIPAKWLGALVLELKSENRAYSENLAEHMKKSGSKALRAIAESITGE